MSAEAQKHLAIMHKAIDEMLAELEQDKIERKRSRFCKKKQKPMSEMPDVQEEEDHDLFTKLHEMIVRDQYITAPCNQGNFISPQTPYKRFPFEVSKELGHGEPKGKGKLRIKAGEGEEVDAPLRSPQEFYPYCI